MDSRVAQRTAWVSSIMKWFTRLIKLQLLQSVLEFLACASNYTKQLAQTNHSSWNRGKNMSQLVVSRISNLE